MDITANPTEGLNEPAASARAALPQRSTPFERRRVLSAAVDIATPEQIVNHLIESAESHRGCSVVGISAPYATAMKDDAALRDAFLKADLLIPDGKGFTWAARMLNVPCGERIAVPDLCDRLLEAGNARGWKVFIYGATDEVNALACANVRARFPGLAAVEGQHGYSQGTAEEDALIARLKNEQFHLLIVARPSPDKEHFLARGCKEAGVVGLAAGGYADILAGKTRRAPEWIQSAGMEWLYRIVQEPRRLWKRIGVANLRFVMAVLWAHVRAPALRPWWGCPLIQVAAVLLVFCAAYGSALNAPYHFDDPEYIQDNPTIRSFSALSEIKVLGFRKLWWFSNAACYQLSELFGNHQEKKPDVRIFRAWNYACHFIAALALLGLLRRALRASGHIPPGQSGNGTPYDVAAFAAAAIFAAHPLCTEAVTYISGRDNGQGGMFYLLGLYAAAIAFERMGLGNAAAQMKSAGAQTRWPRWFWPLVVMAAFGGCAVLTKESHLTFPGAVALLYFFFYRASYARTISMGLLLGILASAGVLAWGAAGRRDGYFGVALQIIAALLISGGMLGARKAPSVSPPAWRALFQRRINLNWAFLLAIAGLGVAGIIAFPYAYERTIGALTGYLGSSYVRSLCTQAHAVPLMLMRAIAPFGRYGLNIDHDFPSIDDPSDPRVVWGGAILLALAAFGLIGMWRRWLGGFGILLALLYIAPTNTIIERGDIVSERNFYLAAAGGAIFLGWLMAVISSGIVRFIPETDLNAGNGARLAEAGLWTGVMGCCLAGPFASLTVLRNDDWGDSYRLWEAARKRSPDRLRVLYNCGIASFARKHYDDAETHFSNLIKIGEWKAENKLFRPDETVQVKCFHLGYANLAVVTLNRWMKSNKQNDFTALSRADKIFNDGLERTVFDPDLTCSYAAFLMQMGRAADAAPKLQQSLNLHPWAEQIFFPLGAAYLEAGKFELAKQYLAQATAVQEKHTVGVAVALAPEKRAELYAHLGLAKIYLKEKESAREDFRLAFDLDAQTVINLMMGSLKCRNMRLKPVEHNPPDMLLTTLSITRRDVLETMVLGINDLVKQKPERKQSMAQMLCDLMDSELKRRGAIQQKRRAYGFLDDPDAD